MNTPIPERAVYPIARYTEYSPEEVRNLTDEQLNSINWRQIGGLRGVGPTIRKELYQWLTDRGIKSAYDLIQRDLFNQEELPKDDTKLRLRILELKVEYDKAMQDGSKLSLEECYGFVRSGIK